MADPASPVRVMVGVVGHRTVAADDRLRASVTRAVERILEAATRESGQPVVICVLTAGAEGADRVVTRHILDEYEAELELTLPMPVGDFVMDFETEESKREFEELRQRASWVTEPIRPRARPDAYQWAGERIVARADALIAVWDGHDAHGIGGTGEIVKRAEVASPSLPLFHIRAVDYGLAEPTGPVRLKLLRRLAILQDDGRSVAVEATPFHLPEDAAEDVQANARWFGRYLQRAESESRRSQLMYRFGMLALISGAWVATVIAALHGLLRQEWSLLPKVEAGLLLGLVVFYLLLLWKNYHRRYLDSRALAEWCRSAMFRHISTASSDDADDMPDSLKTTRHWLLRAREQIWWSRPDPPERSLGTIKDLCAGWLEGQRAYHAGQRRHHTRLQQLSYGVILGLFASTVVVAVIAGWAPEYGSEHWLAFLAVTLPATGGALAAIQTTREFRRNADRSASTVEYLEQALGRLGRATDLDSVNAVANEAASRLVQENRDWVDVMTYHEPELHV